MDDMQLSLARHEQRIATLEREMEDFKEVQTEIRAMNETLVMLARVHKTYLINMYCVDTVQNNIVFMSNGEKAVIGKSKIAEFKRVYRQFVKDYYVKV